MHSYGCSLIDFHYSGTLHSMSDSSSSHEFTGILIRMSETTIDWGAFERVELRVGTIVTAEEFPEARKPAYQLTIDFGPEVGTKRSSAQITDHYTPATLVGRQVIAVVNFPPKQVGPFVSECLTTGFADAEGKIVLAEPERPVPNGARLY